METQKNQLPKYIGAELVAKHLDISQQSVSKTGRAMLNPGYNGRGSKVPRPDAVIEGKNGDIKPLWLASRFEDKKHAEE